MLRKPTDTVKLQLRLAEALRRRLERAATASNQSMNAEIISRLEQSFRRDDVRPLLTEIGGGLAASEARLTKMDQTVKGLLTVLHSLMERLSPEQLRELLRPPLRDESAPTDKEKKEAPGDFVSLEKYLRRLAQRRERLRDDDEPTDKEDEPTDKEKESK